MCIANLRQGSHEVKIRTLAATAAIAALALTTTACGGSSNSSSSSSAGSDASGSGGTITYWASNQGTSLDNDKEVLTPELEKFTKQTGIKVNLEVIGWNDLQTRIQTATTSGQGPTSSTSATPGRPRCRRPARSCPSTTRR